jgi:hypothetical protein
MSQWQKIPTSEEVAATLREYMRTFPGSAVKTLRLHRYTPSGDCAGCSTATRFVRYPCQIVTAARDVAPNRRSGGVSDAGLVSLRGQAQTLQTGERDYGLGSGDKTGTTIPTPAPLGEVVVPGNPALPAGPASKAGVNISSGQAFKQEFMEIGAT